jgi:hypothetical protein
MFGQDRPHVCLGEILAVLERLERRLLDVAHEIWVCCPPAFYLSFDRFSLTFLRPRHRFIGVRTMGVLRGLVPLSLRVIHNLAAHLIDDDVALVMPTRQRCADNDLHTAHAGCTSRPQDSSMTGILPPTTDNRPWSDITLRATHRLQRSVSSATPPVEPSAQRCQHLHHVTHQIVVDLTRIEDHQPSPVRRQC